MIYPDIKEMVREELGNNRDHYVEITNGVKYSKNSLLRTTDPVLWDDIIVGYEQAITELILEDLLMRFPELQIDSTWEVLEDIDLLHFIEPDN